MQNIYEGVLQFKGTWRHYQQRVLLNSQKYLEDRKVHIVAAPGSGKTTLGIELIRRLGAPCLILSPSITIRQQWLERITEGFLVEGHQPEELLSNDLRNMKRMTAITYQALYSAMKNVQGALGDPDEEEDEELTEVEEVDFRDFHIFDAMAEAGVRTICLDEAHHLRSEWWKALEAFLKELDGVTVISLTATPPYDSTPAQWKRYIDMCGPIDEEIFTPELVKEGSLCPHDDYVYFNWPTKAELDELDAYQQKVKQVRRQLLEDHAFTQMIATHKGLRDPEGYSDRFLENPPYFSSLLIFCQAQNIPFPAYLKDLIGTKGRLPELDDRWLEILLQGFLYDDTNSYEVTDQQRQELLKKLKEANCIYRKEITLTHEKELQKLLVKSRGKMESIGKIVEAEHSALGNDLRLLVLCDYIKKDKLSLIGTDRELVTEIGAVPIFEFLRRKQWAGIRLGCLSGTVVIVPADTKEKLEALLHQRDCEGSLSLLGDTGYGVFQIKGKSTHVVAAVTELFQQGEINTLIGTKSLLGEGWDAPCINTLILATYVGSFMLSNQMRGRTIRTDREHPEKTGNIWHLACVFPKKSGKEKNVDLSGDYETLARRFDAFLGVSFEQDVIESGIDRLGIPNFDSREQMEGINRMMLQRAADRNALRMRWQNAITEIRGNMEIEQVEAVPRNEIKTGYVFFNALGMEFLSIILAVLLGVGRLLMLSSGSTRSVWTAVLGVGMIVACFFCARYGIKLFRFSTPERRMKRISQETLNALVEIGEIEDPKHCAVKVQSADGLLIGTWLNGGSMRDKTTFAACMEEIWGVIDSPSYLLMKGKKATRTDEFYCVPEVFGKQKEKALVFEKHMRRVLGNYRIVYTRTPEGRRILLRARTRSFVNKNQQVLLGKKVAKGQYE